MARGSRRIMKAQAKVMRDAGEPVVLLIPAVQAPSTSTPFSISKANTPVDLTTCSSVRIYAKVHSAPGQFQYDAGGKVVNRTATVEIAADYAAQAQACYAVQMVDGSIMLKKAENSNDSGTAWILQVESHVNDK